VGYQAPGTLGRFLLDGAEEIKMMGLSLVVKAEIARIGAFSAHADRHGLNDWLSAFREKPQTVFLIHGEDDARNTFSAVLQQKGFNTVLPAKGKPLFQ
ncbi:MAG: MBL fold metallo-hydrolase, partial [Desulfofustis sp.]|nr:MBL fold metallo-hydrolase [Desulfofustis sp.]